MQVFSASRPLPGRVVDAVAPICGFAIRSRNDRPDDHCFAD